MPEKRRSGVKLKPPARRQARSAARRRTSHVARRTSHVVVRKLGLPQHRELAMGAIASGGVRVLNDDVVAWYGVSPAVIDAVAREEQDTGM